MRTPSLPIRGPPPRVEPAPPGHGHRVARIALGAGLLWPVLLGVGLAMLFDPPGEGEALRVLMAWVFPPLLAVSGAGSLAALLVERHRLWRFGPVALLVGNVLLGRGDWSQ